MKLIILIDGEEPLLQVFKLYLTLVTPCVVLPFYAGVSPAQCTGRALPCKLQRPPPPAISGIWDGGFVQHSRRMCLQSLDNLVDDFL